MELGYDLLDQVRLVDIMPIHCSIEDRLRSDGLDIRHGHTLRQVKLRFSLKMDGLGEVIGCDQTNQRK